MTEDDPVAAQFRRQLAIYSPEEVALMLDVGVGTLKQWRYRGVGPRYVATQKKIFYRAEDLMQYFSNCVVTPGIGPALPEDCTLSDGLSDEDVDLLNEIVRDTNGQLPSR